MDWFSGGWLLVLAAICLIAVSAWRIVPMLRSGKGAIGDGRHVESYGFDLDNALIDLGEVAAAGFPRDGVPALVDPETVDGSGVAALNEAVRGLYLVPDDIVIGVAIEGESRAYPVRVLNWHEVVNDSLGGVPIAVTYNPLCDSVVVFDRRHEHEILEFGVSGLLFNSNLLLYDRRSDETAPSLWSQLQARAISGPAAGRRLDVLAWSLTTWKRWYGRYPQTTVLRPDADHLKRYSRNPYGNYLRTGKLRFPVDPLPPDGTPSRFGRVLVVETDGGRRIMPLEAGAERLASHWEGLAVEPSGLERPFLIFNENEDTRIYHSLWFAWFAQHPESAVGELMQPTSR